MSNRKIYEAFLDFEKSEREMFSAKGERNYFGAAREYVGGVRGFVEEANMELPVFNPKSFPEDDNNFDDEFRNFQSDVTQFRAGLRARLALLDQSEDNSSTGQETLRNTSSYKIEIHDRLNQIRKIVGNIELPQEKKDLIYDKISALGNEVDREQTRLGSLMANVLDISATAGKAAKNVDPLFKRIDALMKLFSDAKSEVDPKLIEAEEVKSLPAPEDE